MGNLAKTRAKEIITLHAEIETGAETILEKAIRIGELLTEQKTSLKHGGWILWVKENLPFGERESQNYMRLFANAPALNAKPVSHLKEAIAFLSEPKTTPEPDDEDNADDDDEEEVVVEDEDEEDVVEDEEETSDDETDEAHPVDSNVLDEIAADVKELKAICKVANALRKRTTTLVKKKGLVSAWLWPEMLSQYLQNFGREIRKAIPHALCPICNGKHCDQCNQTGYVGKAVYGKLVKENEHE